MSGPPPQLHRDLKRVARRIHYQECPWCAVRSDATANLLIALVAAVAAGWLFPPGARAGPVQGLVAVLALRLGLAPHLAAVEFRALIPVAARLVCAATAAVVALVVGYGALRTLAIPGRAAMLFAALGLTLIAVTDLGWARFGRWLDERAARRLHDQYKPLRLR